MFVEALAERKPNDFPVDKLVLGTRIQFNKYYYENKWISKSYHTCREYMIGPTFAEEDMLEHDWYIGIIDVDDRLMAALPETACLVLGKNLKKILPPADTLGKPPTIQISQYDHIAHTYTKSDKIVNFMGASRGIPPTYMLSNGAMSFILFTLRIAYLISKSGTIDEYIALLPHDPIKVVENKDYDKAVDNLKVLVSLPTLNSDWTGYDRNEAALWQDVDKLVEWCQVRQRLTKWVNGGPYGPGLRNLLYPCSGYTNYGMGFDFYVEKETKGVRIVRKQQVENKSDLSDIEKAINASIAEKRGAATEVVAENKKPKKKVV